MGNTPAARLLPARVLARCIAAWAVTGIVLAALWEVLLDAFWLYALGFWVSYALVGAGLGALALRRRQAVASRAARLALAVSVPAVALGLWCAAGRLRAGGNAVAAWIRAI